MRIPDEKHGTSQNLRTYELDSVRLLKGIKALLCDINTNTTPTPPADPVPEIDVYESNWLPFCQNGNQWFVNEKFSVNNITGVTTLIAKQYKQTSTSDITTTAPPLTDRQDGWCRGICVSCRA